LTGTSTLPWLSVMVTVPVAGTSLVSVGVAAEQAESDSAAAISSEAMPAVLVVRGDTSVFFRLGSHVKRPRKMLGMCSIGAA
jgi:hypothetical protein